MRDAFVRTLISLAKEDKRIELLTGDLGFGVLKPFWEQCPNQFTNVGIAEQNMASVAAGMALEGRIVFVYSIGNFPTLRCLEQIRNDCAYHQANVKIVCVGAGLAYGSLGMSHHATEDMAVMRALPGVAVLSPADSLETEALTVTMIKYPGTCYLRLGRGGEKGIHKALEGLEIGKALKARDGSRVAVFSTGAIAGEALAACERLERSGISAAFYTFPSVKPIDRETIEECCRNYELVVTVEEHNLSGGFGGAVAEVMAEAVGGKARLLRIGLNDVYCSLVGSQDYLRRRFGIDRESIASRIRSALSKNVSGMEI